jgi:hypothetical protein
MKIRLAVALIFACAVPVLAQSPEQIIQDKTKKFTQAIVTKDLSVLDDVFEKDPDDLFFDINEGPLWGSTGSSESGQPQHPITRSAASISATSRYWLTRTTQFKSESGHRQLLPKTPKAGTSEAELRSFGANGMASGGFGTITRA